MSKIKKGALIKAWNDDAKDYVVGRLVDIYNGYYIVKGDFFDNVEFHNAIEIPVDLVKQIEELR